MASVALMLMKTFVIVDDGCGTSVGLDGRGVLVLDGVGREDRFLAKTLFALWLSELEPASIVRRAVLQENKGITLCVLYFQGLSFTLQLKCIMKHRIWRSDINLT